MVLKKENLLIAEIQRYGCYWGFYKEAQFLTLLSWAEQESKKANDRLMELKEKNYGTRFGRSKYKSIMTHSKI